MRSFATRVSLYNAHDWCRKNPDLPAPAALPTERAGDMRFVIKDKVIADMQRWVRGELSLFDESWQALAVHRAWYAGIPIPRRLPWEVPDRD